MMGFEAMEILLAEDSDQDAELTLRALKRGNILNKVARVKDGAEALDFLFHNGDYAARPGANPRLVLLDLKMPKMNGIEVLTAIRSNERTHAIPVVVLTSSAEERDIVESYRLGVNSYLVKPVEFDQFVDVVTKAGHYWMLMNRTPPACLRP
ncbi:MAG: response regulator [Burkholderiales bacterium]